MDFESTPDDNNEMNDGEIKSPGNLTIDTTKVSFPTNSGPSTGNNTPTKVAFRVKPALKTSSSMDEDDEDYDASMDQKIKAKKKKKNRTLKWDEAKIQEHDQLRGTRMKIDEPNTPFAQYDSGSETDGSLSSQKRNAHHKISWDTLTNKLEAHAAAAATVYPPSSPSSHGGATTDEEGETQKRERQKKEMQKIEFQELRKRHYNEMEVVRRFRRDHPDGVPGSNGHTSSDNNETTDDDEDNDGDDEEE